MGRVKYLKPLYITLINFGQAKKAKDLYNANEAFYAPKARNALRPIIFPKTEQPEEVIIV